MEDIFMIQLYTGEGKGKTTAAIGQAVRAAGNGYPVVFAQFMKGNDSGELHVLENLPNVKILRSNKNFGFYSTMTEAEKQEITGIHNQILDELLETMKKKQVFLAVLDEVTYPINWGLLDIEKLKEVLRYGREVSMQSSSRTESVLSNSPELVLTGREAEDFLAEAADYITEMKCVRHPYQMGIAARKGIEY
ncbi:MAG: cob(I)yrinic acid a,c-diamide adenosyltransferase [Lachnospiraceae bacterium]|nr:cob(I)yrinic acid a,c-diamide adenosyltransferase [Lachnospiraceae bacterium]